MAVATFPAKVFVPQLRHGVTGVNSIQFSVREGRLRAIITTDAALLQRAYRLRHRVFVESLKWVPAHPSGEESDEYDGYASHLVVQQDDAVVGYLRLICGKQGPFMLQREFLALNPIGDAVNHPSQLELTRICVDPDLPPRTKRQVAMLLYKSSYLWSLENKVISWHVVVTRPYFRSLVSSGFPLEEVYSEKCFDPTEETIYATLDLLQATDQVSTQTPEFYAWLVSSECDVSFQPLLTVAPTISRLGKHRSGSIRPRRESSPLLAAVGANASSSGQSQWTRGLATRARKGSRLAAQERPRRWSRAGTAVALFAVSVCSFAYTWNRVTATSTPTIAPPPAVVLAEALPMPPLAKSRRAVPALTPPADIGASEKSSYRRLRPPDYPSLAVRRREQGTVVLRVLVDVNGHPAQVEIGQSSRSSLLDRAALEAVRTWKFNPGMKNGRKVESWVLVPIDFKLD